jgi:hypothetical protein
MPSSRSRRSALGGCEPLLLTICLSAHRRPRAALPRHMTGFGDTLSRTFLDLLNANADAIRAKAELTLSSTARNRS